MVTDLEMPDMNGIHLTEMIKQEVQDTKVIIMTGCHKDDCQEMMTSRWVDGEGKWHQVTSEGQIKEGAGKTVGKRDLEAEGQAENVKEKAKEKVGEIKDVGGN